MIDRIFFAIWTLLYVHVYLKVSLPRNILAKQRTQRKPGGIYYIPLLASPNETRQHRATIE